MLRNCAISVSCSFCSCHSHWSPSVLCILHLSCGKTLAQGSLYVHLHFTVGGVLALQGEGEMKMSNRLRAPWPEAVAPGDSHLMIGGV
jgi:hypothetical protein